MDKATRVLVVGGQRSGKSRFAERLVADSGMAPVYVAVAAAGDGEMADRIAGHRDRRGDGWRTFEEPLDIAAVIARESRVDTAILVECLTLWLSNLMGANHDIDGATDRLIAALEEAAGPVVLVSNEVGSGIVPDNALARRYADALGILNQRIAAVATHVVLVVAGQPLVLKPSPQPEIAL
jgi:adenosylcobinamide kinase/adenosylcobinamide-phosphate guanylyltransferase